MRSDSRGGAAGMPTLMVVEDNDEDFEALSRILRKIDVASRVQRCENGDACLAALGLGGSRKSGAERKPQPGLILLDLNLPGMDGREVLRAIKTDPDLKTIPVTVLTSSDNSRDVNTCYAFGANAYVLKSLEFDVFEKTVRAVTDLWLNTALLPTVGF